MLFYYSSYVVGNRKVGLFICYEKTSYDTESVAPDILWGGLY